MFRNFQKIFINSPSTLFFSFVVLVFSHIIANKNGFSLFGVRTSLHNLETRASITSSYSNAISLSCSASSSSVFSSDLTHRKTSVSIVLLADADEISRMSLFLTSLRAFIKNNSFKELVIVCPDEDVTIFSTLLNSSKLLGFMITRVISNSHFIVATTPTQSTSTFTSISGPNGAIRALMPLLVSSALDAETEFYLVLEPDTMLAGPLAVEDLVKNGQALSNEPRYLLDKNKNKGIDNIPWYSFFLDKYEFITQIRKFAQQGAAQLTRRSVWEASENALFGHEIDSTTLGDAQKCPYLSDTQLGHTRRTLATSALNPELQPLLLSRSISLSTMCALQKRSFTWINDLIQSYPKATSHRRDGRFEKKKAAYWGVYALYWLHSHCTFAPSSVLTSVSSSESRDTSSILLFDAFHRTPEPLERSLLGPNCCAWNKNEWLTTWNNTLAFNSLQNYKDSNKDNGMTYEKSEISESLSSSSSSSSSSNHLFVVVRGSGQFLTGDGTSTGDIPITNLAMQVVPFFEKNIKLNENVKNVSKSNISSTSSKPFFWWNFFNLF
jgi:hypothetical protein